MHNLSGRSSLIRRNARGIKVKQVRLDDLVLTLSHVEFVKVEVEGPELEVLKGALRIIKQNNPILVIETSRENLSELKKLLGQYYWLYVSHIGGLHLICIPK